MWNVAYSVFFYHKKSRCHALHTNRCDPLASLNPAHSGPQSGWLLRLWFLDS